MRYFSMFTGVGGFELGIERAIPNAECVGYSEIDKYCNMVMKYRFPKVKNYGDATKINTTELPEFDLLVGGFPCQSFSIAGKRRGFEDTRGTLFFEVARILRDKRPKACILENVKGLLNHDEGKTFSVIISTLVELGYEVEWVVLNSKNFGVPQNRERVFIIGHLGKGSSPKIFPVGECSQELNTTSGEARTEGERLYDYVANTIAQRDYKGGNQLVQVGAEGTINCIQFDPNGTGNKSQHDRVYFTDGIMTTLPASNAQDKTKIMVKDEANTLKQPCGNQNRYILSLAGDRDNPSVTVKSECGAIPATPMSDRQPFVINTITQAFGRRGHSGEELAMYDVVQKTIGQIRRLTPVECERLQAFPDNWTSKGINENGEEVVISDSQRYKMMGNAVTTNVVEYVAGLLKKG